MLCFATFQGHPAINTHLNACSRTPACKVVQANAEDKRGPWPGLRTLRDGHGIELLADQGPRHGSKAWFLGQAVIAHKGVGLLVKRGKKPLVVGAAFEPQQGKAKPFSAAATTLQRPATKQSSSKPWMQWAA